MKRIIFLTFLLNGLVAYSQDTIVCIVENDAFGSAFVSKKGCYSFYDSTKMNFPTFAMPYDDINRTVFLKLSKCNYLAAYNEATNTYDFYPSEPVLNFNINSPRVANQRFSPIKVDSFNPHGVRKPQTAVPLGLVNLLLDELQK